MVVRIAQADRGLQGRRELPVDLTERSVRAVGDIGPVVEHPTLGVKRAAERGSHVALAHADGEAVLARLTARGMLADFRPPNLLRFGFAPLYNTHAEVVSLVEALVDAA